MDSSSESVPNEEAVSVPLDTPTSYASYSTDLYRARSRSWPFIATTVRTLVSTCEHVCMCVCV